MSHQVKMLLMDKVSNRAPYWGAEGLIGGENGQGVCKGNSIRSPLGVQSPCPPCSTGSSEFWLYWRKSRETSVLGATWITHVSSEGEPRKAV